MSSKLSLQQSDSSCYSVCYSYDVEIGLFQMVIAKRLECLIINIVY